MGGRVQIRLKVIIKKQIIKTQYTIDNQVIYKKYTN